MQKYQSIISGTNGSVIRNVPVTVLKEDGSLAEIFLDREGQVPAPNPLATDSRGVFYFYAKNGRYSLRTSVDGITITDADAVLLNDPEEITTAGPIADAVLRAEAAAQRAEDAVEASGIPDLVGAAQNAAKDAQQAVSQAGVLTEQVNQALIDAQQAKLDAQSAAQTAASDAAAAAQAVIEAAIESAEDAADDAANSAQAANDAAANAANAAAAAAEGVISSAVSAANAAKLAAEQAQEASVEAKDDAERARDQAQGYADGMGQFIAMAATFTEVPLEFQAWMIAVTQPHLRIMVWDAANSKYVRAPWHAPGKLSHFLREVPAGHIEVRSDVVLNKADFPDLAEYLGVTGTTFVLDEMRGEFLRSLDSGRGVDSGRAVGSWQDSDNKSHTHTGTAASAGEHTHTVSGTAASAGAHTHTITRALSTNGSVMGKSMGVNESTQQVTTNYAAPINSAGAHTHSVSGTAASAGAHTHTVTVAASGGSESRPRNRAYRLAVQY